MFEPFMSPFAWPINIFSDIDVSTNLECGEICSYEVKVEKPGKYYPFLQKAVNCKSIMGRMALNPETPTPPPKKIPVEMFDEFTQNGELPINKYWYFDETNIGKQKNFSTDHINELIDKDKKGIIFGTYGVPEPKNAIAAYVEDIRNKRGVVIGSQSPWLEALALSAGAEHITTLEYNNNMFLHPKITKIHPYDMARKYRDGSFQAFDFALSFSSIEHSGLGRYGDPLNPYGDLEAVAQVWCMLKPGGLFQLGVPETHANNSFMEFNAHRVYGHSRLKHLTANFEVLDHFSAFQGVWVLKKT
ncbi:unnamed protein product [Owenia fusiformis]|uniref:DUF268 domain-containing protein n=1 Tax=Owenia fusiformis TaxID=6347 RepID=A0A8S4NIC4_OWEFU|nr:unnamed protein product [Owenia fusiformis]